MLKGLRHGVRLTALALGLATTGSLAFFIEMTETEMDQSACESASVTVAVKLTE